MQILRRNDDGCAFRKGTAGGLLLVSLSACFTPAPPLEEGDAIESSVTVKTDPDGNEIPQGHPVVLKRQVKRVASPSPGGVLSIPPVGSSPQPVATVVPTGTATPVPTVTNTVPLVVTGLKPSFTGTCDPAAQTLTATTTSGRVISSACSTSGVSTVLVHLPAGSGTFDVTISQSYPDGFVSTKKTTYFRSPFLCPTGYVGVPGSGISGLGNAQAAKGHADWWLNVDQDFCVMKYPAKKNNSSTYAASTASGHPWVSIKRGTDESDLGSAFKSCKDAPGGGVYRLISNTQWQTVARNAENVAINWSGGAVGSGVMAKGHSDNLPSTHLENSADADPYYLTGNNEQQPVGSGWEQKRTHTLSNGEVIWDFGGNVWQWVSDKPSALGMSPLILYIKEYNISSHFSVLNYNHTANRLIFAPAGNYSTAQNVGNIWGGTADGLLRGWYWSDSSMQSGIFTATLNYSQSYSTVLNGFRCAHLP